jgi:hypothetical protein
LVSANRLVGPRSSAGGPGVTNVQGSMFKVQRRGLQTILNLELLNLERLLGDFHAYRESKFL